MFNLFSILIHERLLGKKLPVIMGETTGISERTWRKRLKDDWIAPIESPELVRKRIASRIRRRMKLDGGYSEEEIDRSISLNPSWKAGIALPTADLIWSLSPGNGEEYTESIAAAKQFDLYCTSMQSSHQMGDIEAFRQVVTEALRWLRGSSLDSSAMPEADQLERTFRDAPDLEGVASENGK